MQDVSVLFFFLTWHEVKEERGKKHAMQDHRDDIGNAQYPMLGKTVNKLRIHCLLCFF